MENQHRKIRGYRELGEKEIALMNQIKAKSRELLELQAQVLRQVQESVQAKRLEVSNAMDPQAQGEAREELEQMLAAEPERWCSIAKTQIQQGTMALVRAVAQPGD